MITYKTIEGGIDIVEYDDSFAASIADMRNKSQESWGGGSDIFTEEQIVSQHKMGAYYNVYLAVKDGEALGYCSLARYEHDASALYIQFLNVRPDYHSKKLGKALVLMCVWRTIELGFPRLLLHTWAGNTKAVPLYKKCGFMWEDFPNMTLLSNYIPTIVAEDLFKPFFAGKSWYDDSARAIEIKPDGIKEADFERFRYSWEKDGERLEVGVEKSGRRICGFDTGALSCEMTAENHKLAFGLTYNASFSFVNKGAEPLIITVKGRDDGALRFDAAFELDIEPGKAADITTSFTLAPIDEEQSHYRVHPCVLADVTVNGVSITMGLGIEPKFPVKLTLHRERVLFAPGFRDEAHISLASALPTDAVVSFRVSESPLLRLDENAFTLDAKERGKASVKTMSEALRIGYERVPVACRATLADGRTLELDSFMDVLNQGLTGRYSFKADDGFGIVNGPYMLKTYKNGYYTWVLHALNYRNTPGFPLGILGKPYEDEFNVAKPTDVRTYETSEAMVIEFDFLSQKRPGIEMTTIFTMSGEGVFTRRHRVTNKGREAFPLCLKEDAYICLESNAVYAYNGKIVAARDADDNGFSFAESRLIEENWVFEADLEHPVGACWPPEYKVHHKWNDAVSIEHDMGALQPGGVFETKPITVVIGLFKHYNDFRNYAAALYRAVPEVTEDITEVVVNGYNPFITGDAFDVKLVNNRNRVLEGAVSLSPVGEGFFTAQTQENPAGTRMAENAFHVDVTMKGEAIRALKISQDMKSYKKSEERIVFFPAGDIQRSEDKGVLTVSNGVIEFSSDPAFFNGIHSLRDAKTGSQWLFTKYPSKEPFAWWSPFIGGIYMTLSKLNSIRILEEELSCRFTEVTDNLGNVWSGIAARVNVVNNDDYKGLSYDQFFLTLPGVPVLCHFVRFYNGSGGYLRFNAEASYCLNPGDVYTDAYAEFTSFGKKRCTHMGGGDEYSHQEKLLRMFADRKDSIYTYTDAKRANSQLMFGSDSTTAAQYRADTVNAPSGETVTLLPSFTLITDMMLTERLLTDLSRIEFNGEARK